MPDFRYQAINASKRPVSGVVEAASVAEAAARLESGGLSLVTIALASDATAEPTPALTEAVRRLHGSRDQLLDPLVAYASELPRGQHRRELNAIVGTLRQDDPAASATSAAAKPKVWAPLLAAAAIDSEDDAASPSLFSRFLDRDRREQQLRRYRVLALAYPLFVLLLLILVMWPIGALITPTFQQIYDDFGLDLPSSTRTAIAVGNFLSRGGGFLLLSLVAVIGLGTLTWQRWGPGLLGWTGLGFGRRQSTASAAQFIRCVADLIEARLPISEAAHWAEPSIDDASVRSAAAYALRVEMPLAARVALLRDLSACYADRSEKQASWVTGAVGPAAIVLVGIVVGFTVIALFAPLVNLIQGLT